MKQMSQSPHAETKITVIIEIFANYYRKNDNAICPIFFAILC